MNIVQANEHKCPLQLHDLKPGTVFRYTDSKQVHQQNLYLMLDQQCYYFEKLHKDGKRLLLDLKTDKVCQHDAELRIVIIEHALQIGKGAKK